MNKIINKKVIIDDILNSYINIRNSGFIYKTNLEFNEEYSKKYNCNLFIKREDTQKVRSFKIRGAFNKIYNLDRNKKNNIICASAGNHAQGFAYVCNKLKINGTIYIPENTPIQKIERIKYFSNDYCKLILYGNNFSQCLKQAQNVASLEDKYFIHPYNDLEVIHGQATIAKEIYDDINPDIIISCIGGGGLISGIGLYSKLINPKCYIFGAQPESCPTMLKSLQDNTLININITNNFVDGASVGQVGDLTFEMCKQYVDRIYTASDGRICKEMIELYNNEGIITEPAGALSLSILDKIDKNLIKNKNIVCILSGGNNDISRYKEIEEKYLRFLNKKHYYIIKFSQTPGQLKKFMHTLCKGDDIFRFEYLKKTNSDYGDVLIGIEVANKNNIYEIETNLTINNFKFIKIDESNLLYSYLI